MEAPKLLPGPLGQLHLLLCSPLWEAWRKRARKRRGEEDRRRKKEERNRGRGVEEKEGGRRGGKEEGVKERRGAVFSATGLEARGTRLRQLGTQDHMCWRELKRATFKKRDRAQCNGTYL